ncbi:AN1-type zinc finger protein 6 [Lingula anatina]|uniref:AN1-type zinc finger protein 6 n=1 Tax=Lingula anatina TaxID=7574 RepID=A0A1S3J6U3_LINAN|nr:AN1-type zinc finger protein 6 [Lingula anatina]|eukprot:XP_013406137.1 AN1-type zinc finger protein 6 [Lingula anatina]
MEQNDNQNLPPSALCRNGCGFYGNASFDGMCSKCFKDALKRKQNTSGAGGRMSPTTSTTTDVPSMAGTVVSTSTSVETASPTVPSPIQQEKGEEKEEGATGGIDTAKVQVDDDASSMSGESSSDKDKTPKKKNRCFTCKKKVGLTGFECRCGGLFCGLHRYSDKHDCTFNYKEHAQVQLRKLNPVIVGEKIQKI